MKRIAIITGVLVLLNTNLLFAFDHNYTAWGNVLAKFVHKKGNDNLVNYAGIAKDRSDLDAFLKEVETVKSDEYQNFTSTQKLAFLFNSYNALTIKFILIGMLDGSVKSIKDLGSVFKSPWKKKFFNLFGEESYLDHLEHDLARAKFNEPRVHFAFNCASKSCPNLQLKPFLPAKLNAQLDAAIFEFLSDANKNYYSSEKKTLFISSIFKWYGDDFKKNKNTLNAFLAVKMPLPPDVKKAMADGKVPIKFLDYDWSLNAE
jgi:hypothetical protein